MQMESVETKAGTAICCAPSRMARVMGLRHAHVAVNVFDFDGGVVDQNADGQRQAAERHDVDGLAQQAEDNERGENGERDRACRR